MSNNDNSSLFTILYQIAGISAGVLVSVFSWFLGIKFIPPKSKEETAKRLLASIFSSATFGILLVVYIHESHIWIVKGFQNTAVSFGMLPIVGDSYIYLFCLSFTGLCGWWVISGIMAVIEKRLSKFTEQVANSGIDIISNNIGVKRDHES